MLKSVKGEAMKTALTLMLAGILVALVLCSLNYAQDEPEVGKAKRPNEEDAKAVEIGEYEYVIASTLDEKREEFMGKYVKIVDELAVLWDDPTPHDTKEEVEEAEQKGYRGDHDNQTLAGTYNYLKFETFYFRCLLPEEFEKSVNYLRLINRTKNFDDVDKLKAERKLLCIRGKLVRTTVWGRVSNTKGGADMGTETEDVVLIVHSIERPDKRFFKEEPKEED